MIHSLQWVAILGGLGSAALWIWSALVSIPDKIVVQAILDGGRIPALDRLVAALQWQSKLNAGAAILAAVAALAATGAQYLTPAV